jgi:hypothetical protein
MSEALETLGTSTMHCFRVAMGKALVQIALFALSAFAALIPGRSYAIVEMDARQFTENIGVNIHVEYTDGRYANWREVAKALKYLGIREVRDSTLDPRNQGQKSYELLAAEGIRFDFIAGRWTLPNVIASLADLQSRYPGVVSAIEGVNEINNNLKWSYSGKTGREAARLYQSDLYNAAKANVFLRDAPIYNFTDYPTRSGLADFGNIHVYAKGGATPDAALKNGLNEQLKAMPDKPVVCTEFGYFTADPEVGWGGVSEEKQAAYLLRGLLLNAVNRVKRTYIYELLDAYPDKATVDQEKHFGLFKLDYQPKLSATALRNFLLILRSPNNAIVETGAIKISVSDGVGSILFRDSNGYSLVLWSEGATQAHVNLPLGVKEAEIYDPLVGEKPKMSLRVNGPMELTVSSGPIILRARN